MIPPYEILPLTTHYIQICVNVKKKMQMGIKKGDLVYFASKIKYLRKRLKLNQEQFARNCGISQGEISKYETGKIEPGMGPFSAISQYLIGQGVISCADELLGIAHRPGTEIALPATMPRSKQEQLVKLIRRHFERIDLNAIDWLKMVELADQFLSLLGSVSDKKRFLDYLYRQLQDLEDLIKREKRG